MRYLRMTLSPEGGTFHPVDGIIAEHDSVYRGRLLHINLLKDDTVMGLYTAEGDADVLREKLDDHPDVLRYDIFDVGDDAYHLYMHVDQGEPVVSLLSILEENRLILDTPLEFDDEAGVTATVLGEQETLRDALDDIPEDIEVDIEQIGEYSPGSNRVLAQLTDRQREVLEVAVDEGYYAMPRRATHDEVAEEVGCAPSTASEHLRKLETKIMEELVE